MVILAAKGIQVPMQEQRLHSLYLHPALILLMVLAVTVAVLVVLQIFHLEQEHVE